MRWAYRLLLGREAESDAVVRGHALAHASLRDLRRSLLASPEYYQKNVDLRKQSVEWAIRLLLDREPTPEEVSLFAATCATTPDLTRLVMGMAEYDGARAQAASAQRIAGTVIVEFDQGGRLFIDLRDEAIGVGILRGEFEPAETAWFCERLKPGDRVVDIGANIGYFTVLAGRRVGPSGRVYAFEPVPHVRNLLARSVAENRLEDRTEISSLAIGDKAGHARIVTLPLDAGAVNSGGSYLTAGEVPVRHLGIDVTLAPLDSLTFPERVRVMKVDVEGAEPLVFKGAAAFLRDHRPSILCEVNPHQLLRTANATPDDLRRLLTRAGYLVERLDGTPSEQTIEPGEVVTITAEPGP